MAIARVVGPCPNLKNSGDCRIHGRCSHAGEKFKIGSTDCNKIRKSLGLSELR
jgi:hypothetical protein